MKLTVQKEVTLCDACGAESYLTPCIRCKKEYCHACQRKHGIVYRHSLHVTGHGDGFYCKPCDVDLRTKFADPLHRAYTQMKMLIERMQAQENGCNSEGADLTKKIKMLFPT